MDVKKDSTMAEPPTLGEFNGHEIYPMPVFAKIGAVDVAAASRWYEDALGFSAMFTMPPGSSQPSLVHLRRKKYQDILLVSAPPEKIVAGSLQLSFGDDGDIDALGKRARAATPAGASSVSGPVDTPWNTRDLTVTDPSGHILVFTGRSPNPDPEQARRWKEVFEAAQQKNSR